MLSVKGKRKRKGEGEREEEEGEEEEEEEKEEKEKRKGLGKRKPSAWPEWVGSESVQQNQLQIMTKGKKIEPRSGPSRVRFPFCTTSDPRLIWFHVQQDSGPSEAKTIEERAETIENATALRLEKTERLSFFMSMVKKRCPICFVKKKDLRPHDVQYCDKHAYGWPSFKKAFKFEQYAYCFNCGLPQDRQRNGEEPDCHRKAGQYGKNCPWKDFIFIVLFLLWDDVNIRLRFMDYFNLDNRMTFGDFKGWAGTEDSLKGEYYKGLEVFLWYCEEWINEQGRAGL
jgi:hypothetical protein